MRVLAYPADDYGCGFHRVIAPCEVLRAQGHDVTVVTADQRALRIAYDAGQVVNVEVPEGIDVVVFQRVTDRRLLDVITWLRRHGIAVVVDVDDDLSAIDPGNPAFIFLDPNRAKHETQEALRLGQLKPEQANQAYALLSRKYQNTWLNLVEACRRATLVTVSTAGLLRRYAAHGRAVVLENLVPDHYLDIEHIDSDVIGWPAALHSHPNDPAVVGNAISRLVYDGAIFTTIGESLGVGAAFGLRDEPGGGEAVTLQAWPTALSKIGIGIAPLADTLFNSRKSWLKPLEMSAVGVPWVASPRAEYTRLHARGAGLLVAKPKDWYRTLRSLLDEPARRQDLAAAGREVAEQLRLSYHAWRWVDAWQHALELQHGPQLASAPSGM